MIRAIRLASVYLPAVILVLLLIRIIISYCTDFILPPSEEYAVQVREKSDRFQTESDITDRLNLNEADFYDLIKLPGIGDKTANAILTLRSELGRFRYPEDLLLVPGIGTAKMETIYEMICTE